MHISTPPSAPRLVRTLIFGLLALGVGALPALSAQTVLRSVSGLKRVARLTGENSINKTDSRWNVAGTDLGHMFDLDGTLYMVFGDTFGHGFVAPPGAGAAPDWRSNVMAVITDRDPTDGLTFDRMITDDYGRAKQLLAPDRYLGVVTDIPTNGIAANGRLYLHYMAVNDWNAPQGWALHHAGLAVSGDRGQSWTKLLWRWPGDTKFGQVAFAREGETIYLMGIPGGRKGGVSVARVPEKSINSPTAYRYYAGVVDGEEVWSETEEDAILVVPGPVGELSVMWNDFLKRWTMMYLHNANIVIREAPTLMGPWSSPITVVYAFLYPGLYAPYMHPWYVENGGETIYFTMSEWNPYGVSLMKVKLVKRTGLPTMLDVARALRISGGLDSATSSDVSRMGKSGAINLTEASSYLRQVMGID